jgi:RNA polymerase sigma-70 factor (ECF subfamily)
MTTMESQTQRDALLPSVKFVATAPTDEALIAAAKSGDHRAFLELWTRHSNRAFKTAYRITGNRYDAEDASQDTWMRAYTHLKTFDGRAHNSRPGSHA